MQESKVEEKSIVKPVYPLMLSVLAKESSTSREAEIRFLKERIGTCRAEVENNKVGLTCVKTCIEHQQDALQSHHNMINEHTKVINRCLEEVKRLMDVCEEIPKLRNENALLRKEIELLRACQPSACEKLASEMEELFGPIANTYNLD